MEAALAGVEASGDVLGYGAEVWGWCRGTCSLLEEDHPRALAEFAKAAEAVRAIPSNRASGFRGPYLLLRTAEEHFHGVGIQRVAAACRALLRQAGAPLSQRRRGHEDIPDELRRSGVTVRELEVLRLLADRLGNREIAERLFLSPRTVEKHVANVRLRTGLANRADLVAYARRQLRMD